MKKVFISYRHFDGSQVAESIKLFFDEHTAYDSFLDKTDIGRGEWNETLEKEVIESEVLVMVVTPGYIERLCGNEHNESGEKNVIKNEVACFVKSHHGYHDIIPFYPNKEFCGLLGNTTLPCVVIGENPNTRLKDLQHTINDFDYLFRLVSNQCPGTYFEKAQKKSLDYINNWQESQKGILYDPDEISRTLIFNNCCYEGSAKTLVNLFQHHPRIIIEGDGGCGKTFILQKLFRELCTIKGYACVYIKMSDITDWAAPKKSKSNTAEACPIIRHIANLIGDRRGQYLRELGDFDHRPQVVLFLDGLNEVPSTCRRQALKAITSLNDFKVNVVMTTRYNRDLKNSFISVRLKSLEDGEIADYLHCAELHLSENSILRFPLYLRLFKLSKTNITDANREISSKIDILSDVFIDHPVDKFGNELDSGLHAAYLLILPVICFYMFSKDTLTITHSDLLSIISLNSTLPANPNDIAALEACFDFHNANISIADFPRDNLNRFISAITDQLFPDVSDNKLEKSFRICHQDIRDFFAARFIQSIKRLLTKRESQEAKAFIREAIRLFKSLNKEFDGCRFDSEAYQLMLQMLGNSIEMPLEETRDDPEICLFLIAVLYSMVKYSLELEHNGSEGKRLVCEMLLRILRPAYELLRSFSDDILIKRSRIVANIYYITAECYRRLSDYNNSRSISDEELRLGEIVKDNEIISEALNNDVKCTLYMALNTAKKEQGEYSAEAEKLYASALAIMRANRSGLLMTSLYSMLRTNPDLVSKRYVSSCIGNNMPKRRTEAFQDVLRLYENSNGDFEYLLQTALSYMLHGYVNIHKTAEKTIDGINTTFHFWPIPDETNTDEPTSAFDYQIVINSAEEMLDVLLKQGGNWAANCFKGLIQLHKSGINDETLESLEKSFRVEQGINDAQQSQPVELVRGLCLGCFVYAAINYRLSWDERNRLLTAVKTTMELNVQEHSVDSFDAYYALKDIQEAWSGLKDGYLFHLDESTVEKISMLVKYLEELYNKENYKWNKN